MDLLEIVQIELKHDSDFSIELTDNAMVAEYKTTDNTTKAIIVVPESDLLFEAYGNYEIADIVIANSYSQINVTQINDFGLSAAYPNPFNPSTSLNLVVQKDSYVNVSVYDLAGKEVSQLKNDFLSAGVHSLTWTAEGLPSGVYLISANMSGLTSVQKVVLLK